IDIGDFHIEFNLAPFSRFGRGHWLAVKLISLTNLVFVRRRKRLKNNIVTAPHSGSPPVARVIFCRIYADFNPSI
ncbi:MAG: hypothetical protein DI592_17575, partial [Stenotrophomonas maltophilia]